MSTVTHERVRKEILEYLYKASVEGISDWGVDRDTLQRELGIPEKDMDANMLYLARRNLVQLVEAQNVLWLWAKITSFGAEVIKNKKLYEKQFPFLRS
ncbi:MAG: hypothetical protein RMJ07_06185 [Nitrososphaerota archaeon]|nr:hypothetical protein [Candidatus Bathyarchaeota archaeon]MDW8049248.1 hypothetical protein [Nitrososphaerota archaeon]